MNIVERGEYEPILLKRIKEIVMESSVGRKLNPKCGFHLVLMDWLRVVHKKYFQS